MKTYAAIPKQLWEHPRFLALSALSKAALLYGIAVRGRQKKRPVTINVIARYLELTLYAMQSVSDELEKQQFMKPLPDWGYVIDINLEGVTL